MKKFFPLIVLIACGALFSGTIYLLLKGRFARGDVYPPYSSLRSDPLGTMIFYESLQALPGMRVARDHSPVNRLPDGKDTTYLHFAAGRHDWESMPVATYRLIDRFLLEGGRLVITLSPEYPGLRGHRKENKDPVEQEEDKKAPATEEKKEAGEPKEEEGFVSLQKKWGLTFFQDPGQTDGKGEFRVSNLSRPDLPPELKWHGGTILKKPGPAWTIVYDSKNGPVMAEMKRGPGSVVVATDSFFVSNEALVRDRHPSLLSWLVGPNDHVVFDEAHLGIMESPGIAALVRKYRLHGGIAALLVLAVLFIWKSSSSLVPRQAGAREADNIIAGRNAAAGFTGLLRRNIPKDQIFDVCVQEWRKSFGHTTKFTAREKSGMEEIVLQENSRPARERDPAATYERIRAALHRGLSKPG